MAKPMQIYANLTFERQAVATYRADLGAKPRGGPRGWFRLWVIVADIDFPFKNPTYLKVFGTKATRTGKKTTKRPPQKPFKSPRALREFKMFNGFHAPGRSSCLSCPRAAAGLPSSSGRCARPPRGPRATQKWRPVGRGRVERHRGGRSRRRALGGATRHRECQAA